METKFESFWTALNQCPYDLPDEIKPHLHAALKAAGLFDAPQTIDNNGGGATTTQGAKTKKLSGYNIFMKEKMAELKTNNVPSGERMAQVSQLWKAITEEEKITWKNKAANLVPTTTTTTTTAVTKTGTKKLSGYQLYVRETMPIVKVNPNIPSTGRMGEIGKMWKSLSEEDKNKWKVKAEAQ